MTMNPILDLLKQHWKKVLFVVLPIATFLLGRFSGPATPARVVTQDKIVYVEKKTTEDHTKTVDKTKDEVKVNKHVEKTKVTAKDGTVTEKTVTDTQAVKTVYIDKVVDRIVKENVYIDKVVDHTVTIDNQKRFRVSLLAGVQPQILPVPLINSYTVGGEFDVRIIGPLWAGVWAMGTTSGQAMGGLAVGFEF